MNKPEPKFLFMIWQSNSSTKKITVQPNLNFKNEKAYRVPKLIKTLVKTSNLSKKKHKTKQFLTISLHNQKLY